MNTITQTQGMELGLSILFLAIQLALIVSYFVFQKGRN